MNTPSYDPMEQRDARATSEALTLGDCMAVLIGSHIPGGTARREMVCDGVKAYRTLHELAEGAENIRTRTAAQAFIEGYNSLPFAQVPKPVPLDADGRARTAQILNFDAESVKAMTGRNGHVADPFRSVLNAFAPADPKGAA